MVLRYISPQVSKQCKNLRPNLFFKSVFDTSFQNLRILSTDMSNIANLQEKEEKVIVEIPPEHPGLRKVTLNRPRVFNSLDTSMIEDLTKFYLQWHSDPLVNCVVLSGKGKGFCAGGDVRLVHKLGSSGDFHSSKDYFRKEYQLNHLIATFRRPQVSILDGVVMGGGNGVAMHGSFRVATENTVFAMPETAIGLHPDVGASFFLSRLPGCFGEYLGLTGARLDAAEMLTLGLATHAVPSDRLGPLIERLGSVNSPNKRTIDLVILEHCEQPEVKPGSVVLDKTTVDECFSQKSVERILGALKKKANEGHSWCALALNTLEKVSPTSLKVSLRSIREGRKQSLEKCLEKEFRLSVRAVEGSYTKDFYEGVRALLVDKDNNPKWNPATLEEVTDNFVEEIFSPLTSDEELTFIAPKPSKL